MAEVRYVFLFPKTNINKYALLPFCTGVKLRVDMGRAILMNPV